MASYYRKVLTMKSSPWQTACIAAATSMLFAISPPTLSAQINSNLQHRIAAIATQAHGKVSVACALPMSSSPSSLNCDLHPDAHPPMQSVFKLPLALAVLHQVEQGKFTLDQSIRFLPSDRILPHAYSPLQDRYPAANVDIPLRELLRLTVSLSDNAAADILLRVIGGPAPVDRYIASLGVVGFHLEDNENTLHHNVAAQYRNWFEPAGAVQLLRRIADNSPLTSQHTQFLLHWMQPSGLTARLQANLPSGTLVAHKSGTSDVDNGLAHATNDIGLITLPDGRQLAIAVFITDSTAGQSARENAIAQIARAAYDAGLRTPK
jgi:beta-lactamase class A